MTKRKTYSEELKCKGKYIKEMVGGDPNKFLARLVGYDIISVAYMFRIAFAEEGLNCYSTMKKLGYY